MDVFYERIFSLSFFLAKMVKCNKYSSNASKSLQKWDTWYLRHYVMSTIL